MHCATSDPSETNEPSEALQHSDIGENNHAKLLLEQEDGGLYQLLLNKHVCIKFRFIKHWKKNYYDNAGHVPQYYCDEEVALDITPPTIRWFLLSLSP